MCVARFDQKPRQTFFGAAVLGNSHERICAQKYFRGLENAKARRLREGIERRFNLYLELPMGYHATPVTVGQRNWQANTGR